MCVEVGVGEFDGGDDLDVWLFVCVYLGFGVGGF